MSCPKCLLREAAKKVLFLVARPLRPLAPPPGLVAIGTFFLTLKKVLFSSVAHPFSTPSSQLHTQLTVVGRNLSPLEEVDLRREGVQAGVHEELQGPLPHVEHI